MYCDHIYFSRSCVVSHAPKLSFWTSRVWMALSASSLVRSIPVSFPGKSSRAQCAFESPHPSLRASATPSQKARFVGRRKESISVRQLERPLIEYMRLPASQYSVLDAERIERVNDNTFRCYVYRIKFFTFEVCPVLLVKVEEKPDGCCIKLLSCKLEGSPIVAAQNDKFDALMVNRISCDSDSDKSLVQQLTSDTIIELVKDYQAWASGDTSRQPLGTGEI